VLNVFVTEIGLQSAGIVTFVRQGEAAGMPLHVRVRLEPEFCLHPCLVEHPRKPGSGERAAAFARKHKWALWVLLTLEPA
jgi:hypothetical protein